MGSYVYIVHYVFAKGRFYMEQVHYWMSFICMTFLLGCPLLDCAIHYLEHVHWMVCEVRYQLHIIFFKYLTSPSLFYVVHLKNLFVSERPDIKSQFTSILYQLLLDPSDRVCFEAIMCVLGKSDTAER